MSTQALNTADPLGSGLARRRWLRQSLGGAGWVWAGRGGLALLLGTQQLARGASIVAVRIWPSREYTRITIESDGELTTRQMFVSDPPRLAVDVEGMDLIPGLRELVGKLRSDDPNISGIRVGQNAPNVVRLVVDLKKPIVPQVFSLKPVAPYRDRLVLDLYPAEPPDALAELIAQRLADAGRQINTNSPDALAELIDRQGQKGALPQTAPPVSVAAMGTAPVDSVTASPSPSPSPSPKRSTEKEARKSLPESLMAIFGQKIDAPTTRSGATAPAPLAAPPQPHVAQPTIMVQPAPGRSTAEADTSTERLIIIALDPGHGGEDPGAIGPGGTREKDVVLQIAHRLRERINATRVQGNPMRAYMTRDADFFVPLQMRVEKARRVNADLMISIHADAFFTPNPQGGSVFALSTKGASSAAAKWMAQKENAADVVGGLNVKAADATLNRALLDMSTTAQVNDSLKLGSAMLGEMGRVGKLHKPRVEQANFAVLRAPDIPSVLVETAFISNPDEEARLKDPAYQHQLADALMRGIRTYFQNNPPLARQRSV